MVEECRRYGIESLEIVYGTPDFFEGSITSALHDVVADSPDVDTRLYLEQNCQIAGLAGWLTQC
jgi:hypothetical protein